MKKRFKKSIQIRKKIILLNNPEYVKVNGKKYKINTDFRIAIECDEIARDDFIGEYEKALAVIYKLFGNEGLRDFENHQKLLELGQRYLRIDKDFEIDSEAPDMDFRQDMDYIETSFMSDYKIDLSKTKMHWWTFWNLINGLSNSEIGNCCVLNRVRNLRNYDLSKIKDRKEREEIKKAQKQVALKKTQKEIKLTKEQEESIKRFKNIMKGV